MSDALTTRTLESLSTGVAVIDEHRTPVASNTAWDRFLDDAGVDATVDRTAINYLRTLADTYDGPPPTDPTTTETLAITLTLPYHASDDDRTHRLRIEPFVYDETWYASLSVADWTPSNWAQTQLKERAMDEAPVGITISDYTVPDNPLIYANAAFERITGYDVMAVLGRNCRFLQSEATDPAAISQFGVALDNNDATTVELRNERKGGEEFWNAVTIAPLRNARGTVTNWVGFQQDITDRKETEAALGDERDQYALLNQIVRHDIRNDATVIRGWGSYLRDDLSAEHTEALNRIMAAATHTLELTEAVRDLATIVSTDDPTLEPVDLHDVLTTELQRVRSNFEYRSDALDVRIDDSIPEVDVLATSLLSSVFTNLFDNAVFHNDADEIRIAVSVDVGPDRVCVHIADNGPGISDARKDAVFDQGEQGLESSGSGLGLYLVDQLVERFGGEVRLADNDPQGTVVTVELQRA
ncbi:ATP-binding protein [Haloplanus natans]|uniref:ATP-binding protein n=1 Tax=Haloplanus natans TaxID=376171 RepID=UPI000677C067|nr:ATP-binding protein [Haloplanus natans]